MRVHADPDPHPCSCHRQLGMHVLTDELLLSLSSWVREAGGGGGSLGTYPSALSGFDPRLSALKWLRKHFTSLSVQVQLRVRGEGLSAYLTPFHAALSYGLHNRCVPSSTLATVLMSDGGKKPFQTKVRVTFQTAGLNKLNRRIWFRGGGGSTVHKPRCPPPTHQPPPLCQDPQVNVTGSDTATRESVDGEPISHPRCIQSIHHPLQGHSKRVWFWGSLGTLPPHPPTHHHPPSPPHPLRGVRTPRNTKIFAKSKIYSKYLVTYIYHYLKSSR